VVRAGGPVLAYAVAVAHPATDLMLLTLTVVTGTGSRRLISGPLPMLAVGLLCLTLADSGFAHR
jgi:hypothetical protein